MPPASLIPAGLDISRPMTAPCTAVRPGQFELHVADAAEQGFRAALLARHVLDEVELQRAASLARDEDRVAYQVAHVALRAVLGRLTGRARSEVRMTCTPCPAFGGPDGVR